MLDSLTPRLRSGQRLATRDDGSAVLFDPSSGETLEVAADQASLLELVDGRRSVSAIAAEHFARHGFVPFQALGDLLGSLRGRGLLDNPDDELDAAGLAAPRTARLRAIASLRLARFRLPALRVEVAALLLLALAAGLAAVGAVWGRDPTWPFALHLDPLRAASAPLSGLLGLVAGLSLASTARACARAGVAALSGEPARAWELRLHYLVPALEPEAGPLQLLSRRRRLVAHFAALLAPLALALALLVFGYGWEVAASLAAGAALAAFADACPFAPTSLGQGLAALAGKVDLRDHARSYLSRRFLSRVGAREFFEGEQVILITSALAALWSGLGLELLARNVPRALVRFWAAAGYLEGAQLFGAWAGLALVGVGSLAALLFMLQLIAAALGSVLPDKLRARPGRGRRAEIRPGEDPAVELAKVPLFASLSPEVLGELARQSARVAYPPNTVIVRQGDPGDRFFVVLAGEVAVEKTHPSGLIERIVVRGAGDCFGETALLESVPRTATVRALNEVTVLALGRDGFERLVAVRPEADFGRLVRASSALNRSPLFGVLAAEGVSALLPRLVPRPVAAGELVVRRGEAGESFFLVDRGELEVLDEKDEAVVATLSAGAHFGEIALLRDVPRTATVRSRGEATLWSLSKADFFAALSRDFGLSRAVEEEARLRMKGAR